MGFSRQEYWNELLFPPPKDLLYPGIKHMSAALAGRCFTTEPSEAREEIQVRLYWSFCYSRGNKNKQQVPLLSPWVGRGGEGGQADSLYGARVAMCPWVRSEGQLRWFAHPFGGVVCRGHEQYPAFAPSSSDMAVGWLLGRFVFGCFFWYFCFLLSLVYPNCAHIQLFLAPYSFFVFCCRRRRLSRSKHCSEGSQVPYHLEQRTLAAAAWATHLPCQPTDSEVRNTSPWPRSLRFGVICYAAWFKKYRYLFHVSYRTNS